MTSVDLNNLYAPLQHHQWTIPNRFVAQAMEVNSASPGGRVNDGVIKRYRDLARGGWGIVFLEATSITEKHLARQNGLILNTDTLDGFKRLVDCFKTENSEALLLIQLTHSGRQSGGFSRKVKVYEDQQTEIPVLTEQELDEAQEQFARAIHLAHEAGFDGVDIKACHGYLGGELLRPLNNRDDKYGGTAENRSRFTAQLLKIAREEATDFMAGSRVSLFEGIQGGCGTAAGDEVVEDFAEMVKILTHFVDAGADFLNISSGIPTQTPLITRPLKNGDFYRFSHYRYTKLIKESFPDTLLIGSTYTKTDDTCFDSASHNIAKGYTDLVGFGRQNLADPLFPATAANDPKDVKYCTMCSKCSKLLKEDANVYCQTHHSKNPYL